jgi:hypothetical protein
MGTPGENIMEIRNQNSYNDYIHPENSNTINKDDNLDDFRLVS